MLEFLKFTICQFILKLKSKFKMTCDIWTETETLYLVILRNCDSSYAARVARISSLEPEWVASNKLGKVSKEVKVFY